MNGNGNGNGNGNLGPVWKALILAAVASGGVGSVASVVQPGSSALEQRLQTQGQQITNVGTLAATNQTRISQLETDNAQKATLFAQMGQNTAAVEYMGETLAKMERTMEAFRGEIKELSKRP